VPLRSSLAIRALGPYGGSAPGYRLTTFLVDGESALDAGSLTDALPLSAQRRVRRVVLTHAHFDHIASLPFLMENLYGANSPLEIVAPEPVLASVRRDVLNDRVWPDFTRLPSRSRPSVRLRAIAEGRPYDAGGVTFTPGAIASRRAIPRPSAPFIDAGLEPWDAEIPTHFIRVTPHPHLGRPRPPCLMPAAA